MSTKVNPDKNWPSAIIQTFGGKRVDVSNPTVSSIELEDIAHSLSLLCRFTGHTKYFYSVAQHSLGVMSLVQQEGGTDEEVAAALLHDSPEAYVNDLSSPLKSLLPQYDPLSKRIADKISRRFKVTIDPVPEIVRKADMYMLVAEARNLLNGASQWWTNDVEKDWEFEAGTENVDYLLSGGQVVLMNPNTAKREFLANANQILEHV